jgi:beta-lactamase class C
MRRLDRQESFAHRHDPVKICMNARFARFAWLMAAIAIPAAGWAAEPGDKVEQIVGREIRSIRPADGAAGFAVAVRINGRTLFFNYGYADVASKRPVTSDALFNLASIGKVFDATLLAQAIRQGELQLDDPVANFVGELEQGGDIRRVTIGQLATHTSGLLLPQDHPPWPEEHYTLPQFIRTLNEWKADPEHEPGRQRIYTHAGYILLHLAIERRLGAPIAELIETRVLRPLGLGSTGLPTGGDDPRDSLDPALTRRAVQGYDEGRANHRREERRPQQQLDLHRHAQAREAGYRHPV